MVQILFFPGYRTPIKRYQSYFPNVELVTKLDDEKIRVILCHSIGILHALEYCESHQIWPDIVCMDGSYLTPGFVINKSPEIQKIYNNFFYLQIDPAKYKIYLFRFIERKHEDIYYKIIYYTSLNNPIIHIWTNTFVTKLCNCCLN